ncbi:hypothetical protein [Prosthecobacter sp.]|uniref:hypothetical protein n=1 Tax=Prosthecobacter sp. TaxID=1965333 RepID=UPI003782E45D
MRGRFNKSDGSVVSFFAFQDVITGTTGFLVIITIFLALNLDEVLSTSSTPDPHAELASALRKTLEEIAQAKRAAPLTELPSNETPETLTRMIAELKLSIERLISASNPKATERTEDSRLDIEVRIEKQKLLTTVESLKKLLPDHTKEAADAESKLASLESELKEVESRLAQSYDQKNILRLIPQKSSTNKDPVLVVVEKSAYRILLFDGSKARQISSQDELMQALTAFPPATHYAVIYFKPSGSIQFEDMNKRIRGAGYEIGYDLIPEEIQLETTPAKE